MIFDPRLIRGTFLRRYKRFLADVRLETGEIVTAHCPNSGSMKGLLVAGRDVFLSDHPDPKRRLKYTWEMVCVDGGWVGVNTLNANRLIRESLEKKLIPSLHRYSGFQSEVTVADGVRLDFTVGSRNPVWMEVKNVTLVENGVARFPDAVTSRGAKHLEHLTKHVQSGGKSVSLFVVQHHAGERFEPAADIDPEFAKRLKKAHHVGVRVEVWKARVSPEQIGLDRRLPVVW